MERSKRCVTSTLNEIPCIGVEWRAGLGGTGAAFHSGEKNLAEEKPCGSWLRQTAVVQREVTPVNSMRAEA